MSDKLYQREQPATSSGKQLPIKQETTKGSASDSEGGGCGDGKGGWKWAAVEKLSCQPPPTPHPRRLQKNSEAVSLSEITKGDTFLIC